MTPLVIIGCGKAKRELAPGERVPIRDLYTGSLYRARLAYAEALGGPHLVASAAHGLVPADRLVTSYEADLRKRSKRDRTAWSAAAIRALPAADKGRPIEALVAGPYADWIPYARGLGYTVHVPAEGLRVGEAIRWLRNAAEVLRGEPDVDHEREADEVLEELEREQPGDLEEWTISTGTLRALLRRVGERAA